MTNLSRWTFQKVVKKWNLVCRSHEIPFHPVFLLPFCPALLLFSGWLMCTRAKASSFREWWPTSRVCSWPRSWVCTIARWPASSDWHCWPSRLAWWAPERRHQLRKDWGFWGSVFLSPQVSQAGVPGNEWSSMLLEATTEVLKMASSPVALLLQALLQYVTKMAARSVLVQFPGFHFQLECTFSFKIL